MMPEKVRRSCGYIAKSLAGLSFLVALGAIGYAISCIVLKEVLLGTRLASSFFFAAVAPLSVVMVVILGQFLWEALQDTAYYLWAKPSFPIGWVNKLGDNGAKRLLLRVLSVDAILPTLIGLDRNLDEFIKQKMSSSDDKTP